MRRGKRLRRANRAAVLWAFVALAASLVAQNVAVDASHPEAYDPEYAARLAAVRAVPPDRPLLAVFGSSRITLGFAAEGLPPLHTPAGERVAPFNFGHTGAGPVLMLLQVRRLLAEGIRPRWAVVELMPAFVGHENAGFIARHATSRELPELGRWVGRAQASPQYASRRSRDSWQHARHLVPPWMSELVPAPPPTWHYLPLGGSLRLEESVDDATRRHRTAVAKAALGDALRSLPSPPNGGPALRELLALCRREGIRVVLAYTPEGAAIRTWYDRGRLTALESYCADAAAEAGVPMVDARDWLDEGDFYDSHHTLRGGADKFSRRLYDEVMLPLVAGK